MIKSSYGWQVIYTLLVEDLGELVHDTFSKFLRYIIDTVEHLILALLGYLAVCILLYFCALRWKLYTFDRGMRHSRRVLFIIAHPDDECMFFGPTILYYTRNPKCEVYLLCLTTGRNYGMGSTRKKELYKSCKILGIKEGNIFIHYHSSLPDAMDVRWPTEIVSKLISHTIQSLNITTLITFDRYGVSNHCNHTSIYYAVANLIMDGDLPSACGVYVLDTINILRKYWLILDIPLALILSRFRFLVSYEDRRLIHKAMRQHKSQLVWFRYLFMYFSRYMLINTLEQINLVDIELDLVLDD